MPDIINIDERINNTKSFQIAGKTRTISFDDEFSKKVSSVQLELQDQVRKLQDMDENTVENMDLDTQKSVINKAFDNVRNNAIKFFDEYIGEGVGQEIYDYYKQSSQAVLAIIRILDEYSDKIVINKKQQKRNKKVKHYTSNK